MIITSIKACEREFRLEKQFVSMIMDIEKRENNVLAAHRHEEKTITGGPLIGPHKPIKHRSYVYVCTFVKSIM